MRSVAFLTLLAVVGCQSVEPADKVFTNATVYTADEARPTAEAVAVRGNLIVFVGSAEAAKRYVGQNTEVIDLQGKTMLPGMADAHYHLMGVGEREMTLNLEGTRSIEEMLARVKERVDQAQPGQWITGRGWIETPWTPRRFPTRQDLDAVAPNNPVLLGRVDGHASVANSAALRLAGVTSATQPPFGGDILKDASGQPTGMLIDHAQGLVGSKVPEPTEEELDQAVIKGVERSLQIGWTQIQDAGGSWDDVTRFRRLYGDGKLKLRIYKAVQGPGSAADSLFAHGASIGEFDGRFTVRTIKSVLDGALGSRGALLLEPYGDAPDKIGLLLTPVEAFRPMLVEALKRGIQVETHAIGDSANRLLLNTYEEAFKAVPVAERAIKDPRWRDEHTQIVEPSDLPRFKQLGVIPSMQPSHAISDFYFAPDRLGTDRLKGAYAWQTLLRDGNIIAAGSDAPVERGEPMIEFYGAVARRSITGDQTPDWHPEEAMTRDQALKAFTLWPAYAAFEEDKRGTIAVGKWADFTILDQDIMTIPEAEILKTSNVMTVVGGEIVYRGN
jgi:predicted amidohydrolase YtcJ